MLRLEELSRIEQNLLLYLETCAVDQAGRVECIRMNSDDMKAAEVLVDAKLIEFGRIPSELLRQITLRGGFTHWVNLLPDGWRLASDARRIRADRMRASSEHRQRIDKRLREIGKIA